MESTKQRDSQDNGRISIIKFRKQILNYSETFIANYAHWMRRYKPWFTGYKADKRGFHLVRPEDALLLENFSTHFSLDKARFKYGAGINKKWLNAIREKDPKLIHAHFGYDGLVAIHLAKKLKLPLITTFHAQDIAPLNLRWSYRISLGRLFRHVDQFIAVSEFIKSRAIDWGCPEEKIKLHFTGIDIRRFSGKEEKYAIPTIVFAGRLIHKKGCEYAIRSMSVVKEKYREARLLIIGDGFLRPHLEALTTELKVNAKFLGPKKPEEVAEIMKKSWVYCGPSIVDDDGCTEGLPTVFLEAQAAGLPVAGFAAGGVPESVIDGKTALLCQERDYRQLGENILFFLDSENQRAAFGESGRLFVEDRFDLAKQVRELENIYDETIARFG